MYLDGTSVNESFSPKIILQSGIGMVVRNVFFAMKTKHLFFQCCFARSIWSVIQVTLTLYPSHNVTNIFGNWLNGIDYRFKSILGWERLFLFGRYGYIEMIKCLTTKTLLFCRLSTVVHIHYVYGHLYRGRRIETYLWRSVHGWRLRWWILFSQHEWPHSLRIGPPV
jgi:hypothetical protein